MCASYDTAQALCYGGGAPAAIATARRLREMRTRVGEREASATTVGFGHCVELFEIGRSVKRRWRKGAAQGNYHHAPRKRGV